MTRVRPRDGWLCWVVSCDLFGAKITGVALSDRERSKMQRWPRACPRHVELVELAFELELAAWRRRHTAERSA